MVNVRQSKKFHDPKKNPNQTGFSFESANEGAELDQMAPSQEELEREAAEAVRDDTQAIVIPNTVTGEPDVFDEVPEFSREQVVEILRSWGMDDELIIACLELGRKGNVKRYITVNEWLREEGEIDSVQADKFGIIKQIIENLGEVCQSDDELKTWFASKNKNLRGESPLDYLSKRSNQRRGLMQISMTAWLDKSQVSR